VNGQTLTGYDHFEFFGYVPIRQCNVQRGSQTWHWALVSHTIATRLALTKTQKKVPLRLEEDQKEEPPLQPQKHIKVSATCHWNMVCVF
jgi:hypothetical protein